MFHHGKPQLDTTIHLLGASLVVQTVKDLPAMWETWNQSLGYEESLGGGHGNPLQYSCLENPTWTEKPNRLQSMRSQKSDKTK